MITPMEQHAALEAAMRIIYIAIAGTYDEYSQGKLFSAVRYLKGQATVIAAQLCESESVST